jgi:hypothetical protein
MAAPPGVNIREETPDPWSNYGYRLRRLFHEGGRSVQPPNPRVRGNHSENVEGDAKQRAVCDYEYADPDLGDQYCGHDGEHDRVHGHLLQRLFHKPSGNLEAG